MSESEHSHSAEELALLVTQSGKTQEVTETEREILINALGLNELWVRDVMTPRNKVVILDADQPFDKTLEIAMRSKHTRFPLVKGHLDQAIGLIHIKDLFKLINDPNPDLMRIKRDLKIVPDTMPLDTLLKFFLREHAHLAMAVDEFGTPVGIVFLDNVMEELVGDIQDAGRWQMAKKVKPEALRLVKKLKIMQKRWRLLSARLERIRLRKLLDQSRSGSLLKRHI